MKNHNSPLLKTLIGKTIGHIIVHGSHGEVLEFVFTDGTNFRVCTTFDLIDRTVEPSESTIYVTVNDEAV